MLRFGRRLPMVTDTFARVPGKAAKRYLKKGEFTPIETKMTIHLGLFKFKNK